MNEVFDIIDDQDQTYRNEQTAKTYLSVITHVYSLINLSLSITN